MPTENQMTLDERRQYLMLRKPRYLTAGRKEKSRLLSEMEQATGLHRKSLTRLLHAESLDHKKRGTRRPRSYGVDVERIILTVWESLDYVSAERLIPNLLAIARHLARFGVLRLTPKIETQLATISKATVERLLREHRARMVRLAPRGPECVKRASKGLAMKRILWDTPEPGHFEVVLVPHGGPSSVGEYAYTIQMVDVATCWSERVAVLASGQAAIEGGFRQILTRLPFAVRALYPEPSTGVFTHYLVRFWKEKVVGVTRSRGRSSHKNDHYIVEPKNASLIRQYFGQLRLDTPQQVQEVNTIYEQMWLYYNLFQPVPPLSKKRVEGDKVRHTRDQAQTPYQRLLAAGSLSAQQQARLQALYENTNPLALRQAISQHLATLWK